MAMGFVLAGGRGVRMGAAAPGGKAFAPLAGAPMIAHVLDRLRPQCASLAIGANDGADHRYRAFGAPLVPDGPEGFSGPLAGVLAGLRHARAQGCERMLVCPCDCPLIPRDLAAVLARAGAAADVAVARSGGRAHWTISLWRVDLAAALADFLHRGEGARMGAFIDARQGARPAAFADWPAAAFDPFLNVNRPEDLALAAAGLRAGA